MDIGDLILGGGLLWSPAAFGLLIGLAAALIWLAFMPVRPLRDVQERMDGYLDRVDIIEETEIRRPIESRVFIPMLRRFLRALGGLTPKRTIEKTQMMLQNAGQPAGLTALDFLGMRLLFAVMLAGIYYFLAGKNIAFSEALRNTLLSGVIGYFVPLYWLRYRMRKRQNEILRALPDALDMLTVGVEAGLAFESAMLRVGEKWDNPLTRLFTRAVAEMRVGVPRNDALERMAERSGVQELLVFVAVLVQSSQLGVSIAEVLHTQADQMRIRRRQRAEELARQAGIKMLFPLILLIFPSMLIVILGPSVPAFQAFFSSGLSMGGGF
ncbi:type II secretion system F family protein [Chloroflexota bacterium]